MVEEAEAIVANNNHEALEADDQGHVDPLVDLQLGIEKIKIYWPYALTPNNWAAICMVCKWLKFFQRALVRISGEKYPTLSFSLHIYFVLILYVNSLEAESEVQQNPLILSGIQACKLKLQDFLDKSTRDSQYYYYAMGMLL
ncbi:hypothetical protein RhiTH_009671 [Rhizoctonia solani]